MSGAARFPRPRHDLNRLLRAWLAGLLMIGSAAGCRGASGREAERTLAGGGSGASAALATRPPRAAADRVVVRARKALGVPLHPSPHAALVSGRLLDGTSVVVVERRHHDGWLLVRDERGAQGWISPRYVDSPPARQPPTTPAQPLPGSPWFSRSACQQALAAGERLPLPTGQVRVLAWNVRWFPDGDMSTGGSDRQGTDLEWLACVLSFVNADVVALSEIKSSRRARQRLEQLMAQVSQATGGQWRVRLDDCSPQSPQQVGLAWNAARVRAEAFEVFAELNPEGRACAGKHRPGLGARFKFKGGLDLEIVAVHLKSGVAPRDLRLRRRSLEGLAAVVTRTRQRHADDDLLVIGDFNSMGCSRCAPPVSAAEEHAALAQALASPTTALAPVHNATGCSHYFRQVPGLLDLAIAPASMRELGPSPRVRSTGLCEALGCQRLPSVDEPAAQRALSDHCPILIDLLDQDLD